MVRCHTFITLSLTIWPSDTCQQVQRVVFLYEWRLLRQRCASATDVHAFQTGAVARMKNPLWIYLEEEKIVSPATKRTSQSKDDERCTSTLHLSTGKPTEETRVSEQAASSCCVKTCPKRPAQASSATMHRKKALHHPYSYLPDAVPLAPVAPFTPEASSCESFCCLCFLPGLSPLFLAPPAIITLATEFFIASNRSRNCSISAHGTC